MPRAALFLDRDGTLIDDPGYLSDPDRVVLLPGVKEALRAVAEQFLLFLITNQSGIGRGFYDVEDAKRCNQRMVDLLDLPGPGFTAIMIAPEHPEDPAVYRKPSPRFVLEMLAHHSLEPTRCWMVGDKMSDVDCGRNAGIQAALLADARPALLPEAVRCFPDFPAFVTARPWE